MTQEKAPSTVLFGLRFDFRDPDFAGTTMAERYAAVSEHRGSPDGWRRSSCTRRMRTASGRLGMTSRPRSTPSATSTRCMPAVHRVITPEQFVEEQKAAPFPFALPPLVRRDAN